MLKAAFVIGLVMTGLVYGMSAYPGGFEGGLLARGVPLAVSHPGKVFYVGPWDHLNDASVAELTGRKTPSNNNSGSFHEPFKTVAYAVSQCVDKRGDTVFVNPGHRELVSTAGAISFAASGTTVINLGTGEVDHLDTGALAGNAFAGQAVYIFDNTAGSIDIAAGNVYWRGGVMSAQAADVPAAFDVTKRFFHCDGVQFRHSATNLNWWEFINCSGGDYTANGLTVTNCRGLHLDAAANGFVYVAGDMDSMRLIGNKYYHQHVNAEALVRAATGKNFTDCEIFGNTIILEAVTATGTKGVIAAGDGTGHDGLVMAYNLCGHADTAAPVLTNLGGGNYYLFENYSASEQASSGGLRPVVDDFA